ncbi:MAG: hypothetical protein ACYCST_05525 [Acidimicrobiales bacterium]
MTATVTESASASDLSGNVARDRATVEKDTKRRHLAITVSVVSYFALAVVAFLPHGPLASRAIPSAGPGNPAGSDPFQMAWFLSWLPYALTHGLNIFHTTLFDYPQGVNLADNTSVPLLGLLGWPVTATLGPVAAFNFLLRLAFALSATSMFLVLRRWCSSTIAPFVGGLLYGFGPYMVGQELHLDLAFVAIPPLLVLCADELVRAQSMRPWKLGVLTGIAISAELLISPDVVSGCVVMAVIAAVTLAIAHRHLLASKIAYIVSAGAVAAVTFALICGYLIFDMIAGPHHLLGAVIPPAALQGLHADLLGSIVPTSNQVLAPHFLAHLGNDMVSSNLSENGTYLGIPLVILLFVIVIRSRGNAMVQALGWLAVAAFVLSLGPVLTIGTLSTHIPLPERVFAHLPLIDNTIPARYDLYVSLFAAMVLALGLDRFVQRRSSASVLSDKWLSRLGPLGSDTTAARRARVGLVAGITVLSLLPNIPFPARPAPWPPSLTKTMKRLVPPGSVVLTYPYPTPLHPGALLWEAQAGMDYHLLGGYANIQIGNSGHRWPELLSPPYVQELLGYASVGDQWPLPGVVNSADLEALHIFLARYFVGAVVYWGGGDDPVSAYDYLAQALGPPTFRSHLVAIWLPRRGRWRSPSGPP